jgi:hypothetical protein
MSFILASAASQSHDPFFTAASRSLLFYDSSKTELIRQVPQRLMDMEISGRERLPDRYNSPESGKNQRNRLGVFGVCV